MKSASDNNFHANGVLTLGLRHTSHFIYLCTALHLFLHLGPAYHLTHFPQQDTNNQQQATKAEQHTTTNPTRKGITTSNQPQKQNNRPQQTLQAKSLTADHKTISKTAARQRAKYAPRNRVLATLDVRPGTKLFRRI